MKHIVPFGMREKFLECVMKLCHDPDWSVRYYSGRALGELREIIPRHLDWEVVKCLLELMRDKNLDVKTVGVKTLGVMSDIIPKAMRREIVEHLLELTEEEREEVLQRAKKIINKIESKEFPSTPNYQGCMYCDYGELCDDKGKS